MMIFVCLGEIKKIIGNDYEVGYGACGQVLEGSNDSLHKLH